MVPRCQLSPNGFIGSEFQRYNIDDLYDLTLHLHQLFSSTTFVMTSQLTLLEISRWTSSQHGELCTCRVRCHVHVLPKLRGITVLGVWSIRLPFIIKRILGIKRTFPCSFGNKLMCLLTCVYGICHGLTPSTFLYTHLKTLKLHYQLHDDEWLGGGLRTRPLNQM